MAWEIEQRAWETLLDHGYEAQWDNGWVLYSTESGCSVPPEELEGELYTQWLVVSNGGSWDPQEVGVWTQEEIMEEQEIQYQVILQAYVKKNGPQRALRMLLEDGKQDQKDGERMHQWWRDREKIQFKPLDSAMADLMPFVQGGTGE